MKVCGVSMKGDRRGVGEDAAEELLDKLLVDPEAEQRGRHLGREVGNSLPNNQRQRHTCYAL